MPSFFVFRCLSVLSRGVGGCPLALSLCSLHETESRREAGAAVRGAVAATMSLHRIVFASPSVWGLLPSLTSTTCADIAFVLFSSGTLTPQNAMGISGQGYPSCRCQHDESTSLLYRGTAEVSRHQTLTSCEAFRPPSSTLSKSKQPLLIRL
ncbi:hypothetical protein LX36DRAFT_661721 [Colletotrichum falcatum]|nr:hypothetical protein LX36DRAFT_661721 [Colletotrichum falcatum]